MREWSCHLISRPLLVVRWHSSARGVSGSGRWKLSCVVILVILQTFGTPSFSSCTRLDSGSSQGKLARDWSQEAEANESYKHKD